MSEGMEADRLLEEVKGASRPPTTAERTGQAIQSVRYTHDAFIDLIISSPGISQGQLAAHFGYSEGWVSRVMASDAFQAKMAERREQIIDPILRASVEERMRGLVLRSLEILQQKLDRPASAIPDNVALRALELGAKGLELGGFGRPHPPIAPPAPENRLEQLAQRLVELQSNVRKGVTYEAESAEVVEASPEG